jgi:hypothetical protein
LSGRERISEREGRDNWIGLEMGARGAKEEEEKGEEEMGS